MTRFYVGVLALAALLVCAVLVKYWSQPKVSVLVIGGSAAHGHNDPSGDSFLRRAFTTLGHAQRVRYVYHDYTDIGGGKAYDADAPDKLPVWIQTTHPGVLVMAWGILDDLSVNTPVSTFEQTIRDEIADGLSHNAVVLVVTSPVVPSTFTNQKVKVAQYQWAEQQAVDSFHNPNVRFVNLYALTSNAITAAHESVTQYAANSWHPNQQGHTLGGQLLAEALIRLYGYRPLAYQPVT